jgi:hypothetical protein
MAPSGESVMVNITFGVTFFRPFIWLHKNSNWRILLFIKNF